MKRTLQFLSLFLLVGLSSISAQTAISISEARQIDADGVLTNLNEIVILEGRAIGPNFRPGGQTFVIYDEQAGVGITVFALDQDLGYSVSDSDILRVTGELVQFNGLAEVEPTSIEILSSTSPEPIATVVTALNEDSESALVVIKDVSLVDPTQWGDSGSFNVDVTDGTNTYQVRIDSDTDISGMVAPEGTFDLTGIGGQYDQDAPLTGGYQLFPRSISDIDPYNNDTGGTDDYTAVTMDEIRANDADGVPALDGTLVETTAVVYGINYRPAGLQFTIINNDNRGVAIFNADNNLGYTVNEGDMITVRGELSHFSGLTQIVADSIIMLSQDNQLVEPKLVGQLDESTESSLVTFDIYGVTDETAWLGDGSSFNIEYLDAMGTPFTIRIDNDNYWSDQPYPGDAGIICVGIGGQFDNSSPHDSGYQVLPRYKEDLEGQFTISTYDLDQNSSVNVYPNPTADLINVATDEDISSMILYDYMGRKLQTTTEKQVSLRQLIPGQYLLQVNLNEGTVFKRIVKQ